MARFLARLAKWLCQDAKLQWFSMLYRKRETNPANLHNPYIIPRHLGEVPGPYDPWPLKGAVEICGEDGRRRGIARMDCHCNSGRKLIGQTISTR